MSNSVVVKAHGDRGRKGTMAVGISDQLGSVLRSRTSDSDDQGRLRLEIQQEDKRVVEAECPRVARCVYVGCGW